MIKVIIIIFTGITTITGNSSVTLSHIVRWQTVVGDFWTKKVCVDDAKVIYEQTRGFVPLNENFLERPSVKMTVKLCTDVIKPIMDGKTWKCRFLQKLQFLHP